MNAATHQGAAALLSPALRSLQDLFRQRAATAGAGQIAQIKRDAMERVSRLGLPTMRDDTWRYTNLRHLSAQTLVEAPRIVRGPVETTASLALLGPEDRAATVLVVNGHPVLANPAESNYNGIQVSSLRDLARTDPALLASHLEPLSDSDAGRWALVNTALFADGVYLKISGSVQTPLVILHVITADESHTIANPRVIIDAAPEARATIVEHYVEMGEGQPLCNSASRLVAGAGADIEHYRVFATGARAQHIDSLTIRQGRNSRCRQFTIAFGGGLIRTTLDAHLVEPQAAFDSYSLLVGYGSRHVDCVNTAIHSAPGTHSRQTARAIASGTSRVVFNTKVVVEAGAVHADSQQSCRGLLLSPSAEIDARPQLEIHADEVKCAHGATIGRLDPDMLFYLLTRGVDRETAQSLLVYAFLSDVLTGMSVPSARAAIESALIAQLPDSQTLTKFR